jgi:hypothetical protein
LLPGTFATVLAFGLQADLSRWISLMWVFGINTVFYATVVGLISACLGIRRM